MTSKSDSHFTYLDDPYGLVLIVFFFWDRTVFYGEYKCIGPGSHTAKRVPFTQDIDDNEAKRFLSLGYIQGSSWLLPPSGFKA